MKVWDEVKLLCFLFVYFLLLLFFVWLAACLILLWGDTSLFLRMKEKELVLSL